MLDLHDVLSSARTIAVVGCSDRPSRTSYRIAGYLQDAGYRMLPVNPHHEGVAIHGATCYADLQRVPSDTTLDIVNIFRRSSHTAEMVQMVIDRCRTTGERPVIWTQLGVSSEEAETLAREADLPYVRNRCIMVEHAQRF